MSGRAQRRPREEVVISRGSDRKVAPHRPGAAPGSSAAEEGDAAADGGEQRYVYRALGYHLRNANREMALALQRRLAELGLGMGTAIFLRCLWEEDGITQRELARRAKLVEGTATDILRQMEIAGLIVRVRNVADRRKINIYLTHPAKRLFEKLKAIHGELDEKARRGVSDDDFDIFLRVLDTINENIAEENRTRPRGGKTNGA